MTLYRQESFRMELLDTDNEPCGELHPDLGAVVSVTTGATVGRTLNNVILHDDDVALFDRRIHRLQPWMIIDGVAYPLGVFIPTVVARHRNADGDTLEVQAQDQGYLLTATFRYAQGLTRGDSLADAMADLAILAGVRNYQIADTPITLGTWPGWQPGRRIADALSSLCIVAGFTTPWFDIGGTMRAIPLPYVGADKPKRAWSPGTASEIVDGGVDVDDSWNRANEWLAISKGADANLGGRYSLPASHPFAPSRDSNIVPVVRTIDVPGLETTAQCRDRARDTAQRDTRVHRVREFEVQTDPTLEQHDICTNPDGEDMLLADFEIVMYPGAPQRITLRESLITGEGDSS